MKALIIFGSPKKNGNCASLVKTFIDNFNGEVDFVYAFPNIKNEGGVAACLNCTACKVADCVIDDDFKKITKDDYQIVVIASPIYMSNLPGPMFNIISRLNYFYNSKKTLTTPKSAVLILTAGGTNCKPLQGKDAVDLPIKQSKFIFNSIRAKLAEDNIVLSLKTDVLPAKLDNLAQEKIKDIALNITKDFTSNNN